MKEFRLNHNGYGYVVCFNEKKSTACIVLPGDFTDVTARADVLLKYKAEKKLNKNGCKLNAWQTMWL